MSYCDFYACGSDAQNILDFVFDELPVSVYEMSSKRGLAIRNFQNTSEINTYFSEWHKNRVGAVIRLQLHPVNASDQIYFNKVNVFEPELTHYYEIKGWGLIQLYLSSLCMKNVEIGLSHIGSNTQKRAKIWEETSPNLGKVDFWDWKEVQRVANKLNRYVKKLSVEKIKYSSNLVHYILPEAQQHISKGAKIIKHF